MQQSTAAQLPVGDEEAAPSLRLVPEPGSSNRSDEGAVIVTFPRAHARPRARSAVRTRPREAEPVLRLTVLIATLAVAPFFVFGPRVVSMMGTYQLTPAFVVVSL